MLAGILLHLAESRSRRLASRSHHLEKKNHLEKKRSRLSIQSIVVMGFEEYVLVVIRD